MSWQHGAACAGENTDLFFPIGTSGHAARQAEEAKRISRGCPVSIACLHWAITSGTEHGVWGGLTEEERRASRRKHLRGRGGTRTDLLHNLLTQHQGAAPAADPRRSAAATLF